MTTSGISRLIDFLFPGYCICCGDRLPAERHFICASCFEALPRYEGHTHYYDVTPRIEGYAPYNEYHADLVFTHTNAVRDLIHYIKYRRSPLLATSLVEYFLPGHLHMGHYADISTVVPVPLSPKRLRQRGYNQSDYLATPLAQALHAELLTQAIVRHTDSATDTQTTRNREQRWESMDGIFAVETPGTFTGKRVLLVDDLLTSGATLVHLAQAVLADGAESISYYTLAVDEQS